MFSDAKDLRRFIKVRRPRRPKTTHIVLHRIQVGEGYTGIIDFFLNDPEGVATVTVGGLQERLDAIRDWRKYGIPKEKKRRAFVPYHWLIDKDGTIYQMLPYAARGAHAYGYNSKGVGVGFIGDFRYEQPKGPQCLAAKHLIRDLLVKYPNAQVISHDEGIQAMGRRPKHCPGPLFPVDEVRDWACAAAKIVLSRQ